MCRVSRYTHVHVLAHGDVDPAAEDTSYGLVLHTADGEADVDLRRALRQRVRQRGRRRDSPPHRGDARELRQRQCRVGHHSRRLASRICCIRLAFPWWSLPSFHSASKVPPLVARSLYQGLMWGESPWLLLHQSAPDCTGASQPIPMTGPAWWSTKRCRQTSATSSKRCATARPDWAIDAALECVDQSVRGDGAGLDGAHHQQLVQALQSGLRQAANERPLRHGVPRPAGKQQQASGAGGIQTSRRPRRGTPCPCRASEPKLRLSRDSHWLDYQQSVAGFLVNQGRPMQRIASLHWVLVQSLCLSAVLGKPATRGLVGDRQAVRRGVSRLAGRWANRPGPTAAWLNCGC